MMGGCLNVELLSFLPSCLPPIPPLIREYHSVFHRLSTQLTLFQDFAHHSMDKVEQPMAYPYSGLSLRPSSMFSKPITKGLYSCNLIPLLISLLFSYNESHTSVRSSTLESHHIPRVNLSCQSWNINWSSTQT